MPDPVDALVTDLVEWIGNDGRPYAEVIDAWRTSCPRLPVWEEANRRGLLKQVHRADAAFVEGLIGAIDKIAPILYCGARAFSAAPFINLTA